MKIYLKEIQCVGGDRIDIAQNVLGCFEDGNEPSGPIRCEDSTAQRYVFIYLFMILNKEIQTEENVVESKVEREG